jgi:hypothetical protein
MDWEFSAAFANLDGEDNFIDGRDSDLSVVCGLLEELVNALRRGKEELNFIGNCVMTEHGPKYFIFVLLGDFYQHCFSNDGALHAELGVISTDFGFLLLFFLHTSKLFGKINIISKNTSYHP